MAEEDIPWPREEEEYLMKVADQCQHLSIQYNEIYNAYRIHETRFKLPGIILGSFVGMLSFGASQFGNYTQMITIGVGCSSIVISVISSIEAYLKIGETMTNSLVATTALKKLKEKIDLELRMALKERTPNSTLFLRQCHQEYIDIVERAPPLYYRGILSRLRFRRTPKPTPLLPPIQTDPMKVTSTPKRRFHNLVQSIYTFQHPVKEPRPSREGNVPTGSTTAPTEEAILASTPIQTKLKAWMNRAKINTKDSTDAPV